MDTNASVIHSYAIGKKDSKGWSVIAGMSEYDIDRFIFESHKHNTPPSFEQAYMYVLRLVTAHALVNNG